jgi:hypothetical protein
MNSISGLSTTLKESWMKTLIAGDRPTISDWPGGSSKPAATRAPVERAEAGGMLVVAEIRRAYREHLGKAVAPSTVYRLLDRHGWRKVVS